MPSRDLYEILGVSREASDEEIRKAYLKLAHKYHPDKTGGDKAAEDKLKEINAAYDILKNREKRAQYDRFGDMSGGMGGDPFHGGGFEAPFDDLFDMFFGGGRGRGGRRRSAAVRGNDLEARLRVTLRDCALGCSKELRVERMERCGECEGSGAAPGSKPETCSQCGGAGQVRMAQGFFSVTRTCPQCRGTGQKIANSCHRCRGTGRVRTTRDLNVDVPPGIDTGQRLRLAGEGEPGEHGGPRGDLYVFIEVEPDEMFERHGTEILCEVPVSFVDAALGISIRVPTIIGKKADLKIPAGTQAGSTFRLRGLGLPDIRGYRQGDQIVRVHVETPVKLSKRQRELLEEFREESNAKSYPLHRRFLDLVKRLQSG